MNGPDKDWLTLKDVALWLHISESQVKELIQAGDFPEGVPFGKSKARRWPWMDVISFGHLRMRFASGPVASEDSDIEDE